MFINPVQFPLHEPYFDLTLIKVTHTKIIYLNEEISSLLQVDSNQTYCAYFFQHVTSG